MDQDLTHRDTDNIQRPGPVRPGTFMAAVFGGNALGMSIFVAILGHVILGIPARSLLLPYITLLYCGLLLAPSLYWARLSQERPKSCALRFAIAMIFYLQAVTLALGFSAIKLNIMSLAEAVSDFGPLIVPLSALMFASSYLVVRQVLGTRKSQ